jgi:ATP-binding cassette subfamily B protein
LAAVSHADRIFYLDDGRITEQGTHDELMARDGRYAAAYRLRTAENQPVAGQYAEA